jgi:tripartite-type tricarboxylate transporter receptor subunit TctC
MGARDPQRRHQARVKTDISGDKSMPFKSFVASAALAVTVAFGGSPVLAQEWPSKPIRLIVPFPAGGGTDIIGRVLGSKLSEQLKQPVVIENKPGAGGNIGIDAVVKSPADGYTIVLGQTSNLAISPSLYKDLPYQPLRDLAPVALVADAPLAIVVGAGSPFKSLSDLVAAAKAKPKALNFGSPGNGTVAHLTGELLQSSTGIQLEHIPYKGAALALSDVMAGRIDVFMSSVPSALAQVKGGKVRAIAVTSAKRVATLPDVPTVQEAGYPNFAASTWFGILVPAKTNPSIIERLNVEIDRALLAAEVQEKIAAEGGSAIGGKPAAFTDLLKAEMPKWAKVVQDSGAKID